MSTRCQIAFYEDKKQKDLSKFDVLIYRHSDGYPGNIDKGKKEYGVLTDIIPFLAWFQKQRGLEDMEYISARLLQYLCNEYDKGIKEIEEGVSKSLRKKKVKLIFTGILGYGISKDFHGDIEYLYAIYSDRVEVYKTTEWNLEKAKDINERTKKIKTIKI